MDRPSLTPELDGVDYYDVARFDWADAHEHVAAALSCMACLGAAVASESPRYPDMTLGPRTTHSPATPGGHSCMSSSTIRTSSSGVRQLAQRRRLPARHVPVRDQEARLRLAEGVPELTE
jgi:hypothetical protein